MGNESLTANHSGLEGAMERQMTGYPPVTTCIVSFDAWAEGSVPSCNVFLDAHHIGRVVEVDSAFHFDYNDIEPLELIPFGYSRDFARYQLRVRLESGAWAVDRCGMLVKGGEDRIVERLLRSNCRAMPT